jgi:hypothetical protein
MSFALKSGYGDTEDDDLYSAFDWSDWLWNEAFDYEYRQREKGNGTLATTFSKIKNIYAK